MPPSPFSDPSDALHNANVAAAEGAARDTQGRGLPWLSPAVWTRGLLLFFALALLKLALVAEFGQHLYEIHWRVNGQPFSWVNYAALWSFFAFGILSLIALGRKCESRGTKAVRSANTAILVLGLSFIFLTFHSGNRNYLYPVLSGTLPWGSLRPYLMLNLFFQPPYLVAWFAVYATGYYLLARSRREGWALYLTALFAGAYAALFLTEFVTHRSELLVADCLGLVALLMARRQPVRLAWLLLPLAWTVLFAWGLLHFDPDENGYAFKYFLLLSAVAGILFGGATLVAHRAGYGHAWNPFLFFFVSAFLLLTNANYPLADNYGHLLCLAISFPRYFSGELLLVALLMCVALGYQRLWPRRSLWWLDLASLVLIAGAMVDLRLSQIMGVRLGWDLLSFGDSPRMMWRMALPYLPKVLMALAIMVLLYLGVLRWLQHWQLRPAASTGRVSRIGGGGFILAIFTALAGIGLWVSESDKAEAQTELRLVQTSPVWKRVANRPLGRDEFVNTASALGMGDFAKIPSAAPKPQRDLNVVVVFMESSYNKHLSLLSGTEETQPLLSKYKDRMEIFPNFFSSFAGSIHARFATFTSLYPVSDFKEFTQQRVDVKSLFEVLHDHGWTCSLFYSSFFDYTGFGDFLKHRGLDEMYDANSMPGQRQTERVSWGLREEETLGAMRAQIQKYAQSKQRFCLTYVPAAPHYPYDNIPEAFRKHKMVEMGDYQPVYLNALLYMDWVIASILDQLKESNLIDNTIVVITNDHGEMLGGSEGHIGHGWAITAELANTPLIIMDPQNPGYHVNRTIGSQVDLLPTLLDHLQIPPPERQLYQGRSLCDTDNQPARQIYLSSYQQFGIISDGRILLGDRQNPGSSGIVRTITNDGTRTMFVPDDAPPARSTPIARFDSFQQNFLRNYAYYCDAIRRADPPIVQSPTLAHNDTARSPH